MRKMMVAWAACGVAALMVLLAAACGDDNGSDSAPNGTTPAEDNGAPSGDGDSPSGASGRGSATLTIGDNSWTFDNYYCAFGSDETGNDRVSFSSGAFGTHEDRRVQLDVTIQDSSEEDRLEGDGVSHSITLDDIDDFDNPAVAWSAVRGIVGDPESFIRVDGTSVTAETTFNDDRTDEFEEVPGRLEAECD